MLDIAHIMFKHYDGLREHDLQIMNNGFMDNGFMDNGLPQLTSYTMLQGSECLTVNPLPTDRIIVF